MSYARWNSASASAYLPSLNSSTPALKWRSASFCAAVFGPLAGRLAGAACARGAGPTGGSGRGREADGGEREGERGGERLHSMRGSSVVRAVGDDVVPDAAFARRDVAARR